MGVREQCVMWGANQGDIQQAQDLTQKTLAPVASYLFACEQISPEHLKEAQRISQCTLLELTSEEQELFGEFGGAGACQNLSQTEQDHIGKHKIRM